MIACVPRTLSPESLHRMQARTSSAAEALPASFAPHHRAIYAQTRIFIQAGRCCPSIRIDRPT